jgi:Ni,Fe-hydrogenase III component G
LNILQLLPAINHLCITFKQCRQVRKDVAMTTITNLEPHRQTRHRHPELIPEGANTVQLELSDGHKFDLTQVRINRSFVFGLLEDNFTWSLIRLNQVVALRFQTQDPEVSLGVSWTRKTAGELLTSLALPAPATLWFQREPKKKVGLVVLGATRGLVATDSHSLPFVPLQAICSLEIAPHQPNRKEYIQ